MKSSSLSLTFKSVFVLLLIQTQRLICKMNSVPGIKLRAPNAREEHTIYPDYKAMSGGRAELACNTSLQSTDDAITLILWYRSDTSGVPIYTVDARHGSLNKAKHTPMLSMFGTNRVTFDLSAQPALLKIEPVLDEDGMEYRCRVDYRWGRTMSSYINLIVIVPPRNIIIRNEKNQIQNGLIGPYNEGSDVKLLCIAEGGKPTPYVHWYRDNELIDDTYSYGSTNNTVHNDMLISKLSRAEFNSVLSCKASNNLTKPISARLSIDINLRPIDVEIVNPNHQLIAGIEVIMTCESRGSRPPAQLTWYRDNKELTHSRESISHDGNVTTSILKLSPQVADNGAYLSCRAENLRLANSALEDGWKLNVHFVPIVSIQYKGNTIDSTTVNEGEEIVIECSVLANPLARIVGFLHNDIQLVSDSQSGIFANNSSLVITSAKSIHRGSYQCFAINSQGKGMSQAIKVIVQYPPICTQLSTTIRVISMTEEVKLLCSVDAQPSDVQFRWTSNSSKYSSDDFMIAGLSSTLILKPSAKQDIDVIQCWASNVVGAIRQPCSFIFIPPTLPKPVTDCQILNRTTTDLVIDCVPGSDGGLAQVFVLEVYNHINELIMNETNNEKPVFSVEALNSKTTYMAYIYSANDLGKSEIFDLRLQTLKLFNKPYTLETPPPDVNDIWSAFIATLLLVLVLLSVIIAIICKIRVRDQQKERNAIIKENELNTKLRNNQNLSIYLMPNTAQQNMIQSISNSNDRDIRNPDLIPEIYGFELEMQTNTDCSALQSNGDIISNNKYLLNNKNENSVFVTNQSRSANKPSIVTSNSIQFHSAETYDLFAADCNQTIFEDNKVQINANTSSEYSLSTAV